MIPAPDGLMAVFNSREIPNLMEPVYAFGANGDAMVLSEKLGCLVSVHSVSDMEFKGLEFSSANLYERRGAPTPEQIIELARQGHSIN